MRVSNRLFAIGMCCSLFLSIAANAVLLYYVFDEALSLDYARTEEAHKRQRLSNALIIVGGVADSMNEAQIFALASTLSEQGLIVKTQPSSIQIDSFLFVFEEGVVKEVRYIE